MKLDTYLESCTEVYDLSKPEPNKNEYNFYKSYALEAQKKILEPMCGTGRFLLLLLAEGISVSGFDASPHMLAKLKDKAKAQNLSPNIWQGFIEELNTIKEYNLIFIPAGSFCLITDLQAIKRSLEIFYESLNDNGILLLALDTMAAVPELNKWRQSVWKKTDGKMIRLNQFATLNDNVCKVLCKYELMDGAQVINTETEEINVRIYNDLDTLTKILRNVGFRNIRFIKAFNRNEDANFNDKAIIVECQK
ncbi:MAG: class I SAM-dependent methyltransferase [Pseudomonadota bacterium]